METASLPALLLMGPTASGKSDLALALCRELPCEIVSVDSAQVYRGMDIGTAKPDSATQQLVPHHLIDILDPAEAYSAARFASDALERIQQIRSRGRLPLLVGGTMLYFRALLHGLSELPAADAAVRLRIAADAQREGWPAMHARLAGRDPQTAARLHPNDHQRVQRALEIIELSGQPPAEFYAMPRERPPLGPVLTIALNPPARAELHARIERRFHQMMEQGFLDEVRRLYARGDLTLELPSIRSVGYRQLWQHLAGDFALDEAVQRGIAATRQYAKRQLTWLRSEKGLQWLDPAQSGLPTRVRNLLGMTRS